jgi:hypothetical protein
MSGNQEKSTSSATLETSNLTVCLALLNLLFEILALVGGVLAFSEA